MKIPPAIPYTITTANPPELSRAAPMMIPIGVDRTKKTKKDKVVHLKSGWFYFIKVTPTV